MEPLDGQIEGIGPRWGKRLQLRQPVLDRIWEVPGVSVDSSQPLPAEVGPQATTRKRRQRLLRDLRHMGYSAQLTPLPAMGA